MRGRGTAALAIVAALCVGTAGAQETAAGSGEVTARDAVRREASRQSDYVVGTWRLRASWPLQAAVAGGALFGRRPATWDCGSVCEFRGVHVQAEVGTGGSQVTAGWASTVGETDRSGHWLSRVYFGYAVRGAILRTGGLSTLDPKAQTFVGIEGTAAATRTSLSVSIYRRVTHAGSREPWILGAGVGWGF